MRAQFRVYDYVQGESMDVTPKPITVTIDRRPHPLLNRRVLPRIGEDTESFRSLRSGTSSLARGKSGRALGIKMSIDDIIIGVNNTTAS